MVRLILVRHGETSTNTKGEIHKYSDPEKLTPNGIKQIEKTAEALKAYQPSVVYHSTEERAKGSAEIISEKLHIPLIETHGLEERNWGDYSGLSFQEIKQKAGMDNMIFDERYNFVPPKGESWKEAETRLLNTIENIISANEGKTFILITHGGAIRILMPTLLGVDKEESYKYDPDNASISVFDHQNGKFAKMVYNDTTHLI